VQQNLAPAYVSVGATAWQADADAPVLPLEGVGPWDTIRGPALLLEADDPAPTPLSGEDSKDPAQLDLASGAGSSDQADGGDGASGALTEPPVAESVPEPAEPPPPDPRDIAAAQAVSVAADRAARGDQQGALAILDRALDADPEHPQLLVERGGLLGHMGRYAAAERDLKRVLRLDPHHRHALYALGVVMTKKALWGEAVPLLRQAVELDPQRGMAHYYLGEALNHVDDLRGAMVAYQAAAELMPDNPRALYGLGIVYDRLGRPDDAARMYRQSRAVGRR
jgi:Flp pilus assembly protein TadD